MKNKLLLLLAIVLAVPSVMLYSKVYSQAEQVVVDPTESTVGASGLAGAGSAAGTAAATANSSVYQLIPSDWGIYNDGTHPVETTKGINDALKWAHANGKTTFKVPAGTYLISKGSGAYNDTNDRIFMVSNMTFILDDNAIIQKESNGYAWYSTLFVGIGVSNVKIQGGTYRGDRDTHNYSSGGTHEGGYGILTHGAFNVTIDGVKTEKFTGDGICIGGGAAYMQDLYANHFESGGINDKGQSVPDSTKVRTAKSWKVTNPTFELTRAVIIDNGQKLPHLFDIYFYKADGSFLSRAERQGQNVYIPIPEGADSIRLVFTEKIQPGQYAEIWNRVQSKDILIQNSESAFNRRQGLTIGGADRIVVQNNSFHDIGGKGGTAPMAGIDVEGGAGDNGYINSNVTIKNNDFYNNTSYDLIFYDGYNGVAEGNHFGSKGVIGLAISPPFTNSLINNNHFDGTRIMAYHDATFTNNRMNDSYTFFEGPNIKIDGMELTDSLLSISSKVPFGVEASNINIHNNKKSNSGLALWGQPVRLSDVTITGEPTLRAISGGVADGSIFDNLKIINYNSTYNLSLPRGTYNHCVFEASPSGKGEIAISASGSYSFNECSIKTNGTGLSIAHIDADVAVRNSTIEVFSNDPAIHLQAAKQVIIENNTITAKQMTIKNAEMIKVNSVWDKDKPFDVKRAIIRGNNLTSNIAAKGISTIYAGTGAPKYEIRDNTLFNAELQLKANDVNINNQQLIK
jgi:hypothetical protein